MKIREIIQWAKERKVPILWITGISLLVIFIIYSIISGAIGPRSINLIEQPLTFYSKFTFEIPEPTTSSLKIPKKGLSIYTVKDENNNLKVESILRAIGVTIAKKTATADSFYQWKTTNSDVVTYDKPSQTVFIQLTDPKQVFTNVTSIQTDQIDELLQKFVKESIDQKVEYYDTLVSKQGSGYKVEGRKKLNEYPVFQGDNTSNRYFGLYNFTKSTYKGKGGKNIFDGNEQIKIVSKMYNFGPAYRASQFPGCNRAFIKAWNNSH